MSLIDEIQDKLSWLEKERDDYAKEIDGLIEERDNQEYRADELESELKDALEERDKYENERDDLELKASDLKDSVEILEKEIENIPNKKEMQELKSKNKELLEKEKILEALQKSTKAIFRAKRKKKATTVHTAWSQVFIDDLLYRKMNLSYDTKMPLLLQWPSGTGKSTMVRALWEEKWAEVVEFNFNWDTTVEHLMGHKILVDGTMEWEDWPLTDAVRNGKFFIWHELNSSNPEIQFILNGLLELNSKWELGSLSVQGNNWEVITPAEWFRFFWTYNPWYLGTKSFGTSIMSRFIWAEVKPLSQEKEKELLENRFPNSRDWVIWFFVELEDELRKNKDFNYDISTRDIIQCLMFTEWGFRMWEAVEASIWNSIQIDLEKQVLKETFESLKSKYE